MSADYHVKKFQEYVQQMTICSALELYSIHMSGIVNSFLEFYTKIYLIPVIGSHNVNNLSRFNYIISCMQLSGGLEANLAAKINGIKVQVDSCATGYATAELHLIKMVHCIMDAITLIESLAVAKDTSPISPYRRYTDIFTDLHHRLVAFYQPLYQLLSENDITPLPKYKIFTKVALALSRPTLTSSGSTPGLDTMNPESPEYTPAPFSPVRF